MPPVSPSRGAFRTLTEEARAERKKAPPPAPRKDGVRRRQPEDAAQAEPVVAPRARKPKGVVFTSKYLGGDFSVGTSVESRWQTAAVLSFLMLLPLAAYCTGIT